LTGQFTSLAGLSAIPGSRRAFEIERSADPAALWVNEDLDCGVLVVDQGAEAVLD
jgi:hypothetical protein